MGAFVIALMFLFRIVLPVVVVFWVGRVLGGQAAV